MAILPLSDFLTLQNKIQVYGYKIHIHDTCAGQSFHLETIGEFQNTDVFDIIESFFESLGMTVEYFGEDRLNFTIR